MEEGRKIKKNVTTDLDYYVNLLIDNHPEFKEHKKGLLIVMSWMMKRIVFMLNTGLEFSIGDLKNRFMFFTYRTPKEQSFFDRRKANKIRKKFKV
jgi:hypothetical protein